MSDGILYFTDKSCGGMEGGKGSVNYPTVQECDATMLPNDMQPGTKEYSFFFANVPGRTCIK